MNLQDRIVAVLKKPGMECFGKWCRTVDRLWLDDHKIPDSGFRLWFAVWRLRRKGIVATSREWRDTFIWLTTEERK